MKLISGLEQADGGHVYFQGEKVLGSNEKLIPGHPKIAYLSQHFELFNNYYVHEFLSYNNKYSIEDTAKLFSICKIDHFLNRKTNELSGGEKQRVAKVSSEGAKDTDEKKPWTVVGKSANAVKSAPAGRGRGRPPRTTNIAE